MQKSVAAEAAFIDSDEMIPPKRVRYYEYFKRMGDIK